jgi:hypothetical protein
MAEGWSAGHLPSTDSGTLLIIRWRCAEGELVGGASVATGRHVA